MAHDRMILIGHVHGHPDRVRTTYISAPNGLPPGYRSKKVNQFFRAFSYTK